MSNRENFRFNKIRKDQFPCEKSNEFFVYIGNLDTGRLDNNEIKGLVSNFISSEKAKFNRNVEIESIKIFKDSVYLKCHTETDAINAAKYFHNFNFKNFTLTSYYIDPSKQSKNDESYNENEEEDQEPAFKKNRPNKIQYSKIECEIIASNRSLKKYTDSVNEKLCKELFGLNTQIKYLSDMNNGSSQDTIDYNLIQEAIERGLLYLIYIDQSNEQFNSINMFVFNKWRISLDSNRACSFLIKENKNMPLNKALDYLRPDYYDYIHYLKISHDKVKSEKEKCQDLNLIEEIGGQEFFLNKSSRDLLSFVFKQVSASEQISVRDIDFLMTYLNKQKSNLVPKTEFIQQPSNGNYNKAPPLSNTVQPNVQNLMQNPPRMPLLNNQPPSLMSLAPQRPQMNMNNQQHFRMMNPRPNFNNNNNNFNRF